jgi:hypothetical protein
MTTHVQMRRCSACRAQAILQQHSGFQYGRLLSGSCAWLHTAWRSTCQHHDLPAQAMSPLVLTLAQTLDPVIGSLLGWGFGLMAAPGLLTYAGGGVLLGATAYVTVAGGRRRKQEKEEAAAKAGVLDDGDDGYVQAYRTEGLLSARV